MPRCDAFDGIFAMGLHKDPEGGEREKDLPCYLHQRVYTRATPTCCCGGVITFLLQRAITFQSAHLGRSSGARKLRQHSQTLGRYTSIIVESWRGTMEEERRN